MSPAVKMLDPRRPCPVFSSGKSPFAVRRKAKYDFGMRIEKRPFGSKKSLMTTGATAACSSAKAAWYGAKITAPTAATDPNQSLRLTVMPSSDPVRACTRVHLAPRDALTLAKDAEKADDVWMIVIIIITDRSVILTISERILDLSPLSCNGRPMVMVNSRMMVEADE
jgi:hypothetical protein